MVSMMRIGPVSPPSNVIGDDTFQNGSLKHPVELPLIRVEVVGRHRIAFARNPRLLFRGVLDACVSPAFSGF